MLKIKSILKAFFIVITVGCMLSGCSSKEPEKKVNLVVIGCARSNMNRISMDMKSLNDLLFEACYSCGKITFITSDGEPDVYGTFDIPEPPVKGMDETSLKRRASKFKDQLKQILYQGTAKYPETDLLSALQLASKAFADADSNDRNVLFIADSGLSTVKVDFRKSVLNIKGFKPQPMLYAKPESIVDELRKEYELPKLNNAQVFFSYCGCTAAPQEDLSEKQKEYLKNIWNSILIAGESSEVVFTNDFATDMPYEGLPSVSTVPVEKMSITPVAEEIETVVLDERKVQFIGDTAEYTDPEAAERVLREVAECLMENPYNILYLAGTTATVSDTEYCRDLSERRAEAVMNTLLSFGIPQYRLIPVGLGFSDPWHEDDRDEKGQIKEKASLNRSVRIVDINSEDGEKVRASIEER
ncbi:MAG: OmpA family protein [Lachnospiraceae bacterium]|nr:OmpA family protein [Lachnospiraceae bacterium]